MYDASDSKTLVPKDQWNTRADLGMWERHLDAQEGKKRRVACLNGQFLLHHYTTHHNNIETLTRGVLERIFYVKSPDGGYMEAPTPVRGIFNTCNRYRNKVLKAMRTPLDRDWETLL